MNDSTLSVHSPILWRCMVGSLQWKNNIVVDSGNVFISTCGLAWNESDNSDGMLCLTAATGAVNWFCQSDADLNEFSLTPVGIVVGSDSGKALLIDRTNGAVLSSIDVGSPVYSRPLVFESGVWNCILISHDGVVIGLRAGRTAFERIGRIPYKVRAGLVLSGDATVIALAETGEIIEIKIGAQRLRFELLNRVYFPDIYAQGGISEAGLFATPVIHESMLVCGYVRSTMYEHPPLLCLDAETGNEIWRASRVPDEENFGNCRVTPVIVGDQVIVAFAYTDCLYSFDLASGEFLWKVGVGLTAFQQWSSPVFCSPDSVYLGRVDGVLSKVDIESRSLVWSRSLETSEREAEREHTLNNLDISPGDPPTRGICSTPTASGSLVFVGLTSGALVCIDSGLQEAIGSHSQPQQNRLEQQAGALPREYRSAGVAHRGERSLHAPERLFSDGVSIFSKPISFGPAELIGWLSAYCLVCLASFNAGYFSKVDGRFLELFSLADLVGANLSILQYFISVYGTYSLFAVIHALIFNNYLSRLREPAAALVVSSFYWKERRLQLWWIILLAAFLLTAAATEKRGFNIAILPYVFFQGLFIFVLWIGWRNEIVSARTLVVTTLIAIFLFAYNSGRLWLADDISRDRNLQSLILKNEKCVDRILLRSNSTGYLLYSVGLKQFEFRSKDDVQTIFSSQGCT